MSSCEHTDVRRLANVLARSLAVRTPMKLWQISHSSLARVSQSSPHTNQHHHEILHQLSAHSPAFAKNLRLASFCATIHATCTWNCSASAFTFHGFTASKSTLPPQLSCHLPSFDSTDACNLSGANQVHQDQKASGRARSRSHATKESSSRKGQRKRRGRQAKGQHQGQDHQTSTERQSCCDKVSRQGQDSRREDQWHSKDQPCKEVSSLRQC